MQLRETEIDLPAERIHEQFVKPLFERPYGSVLATFDPQTLLVDALPPRAPHRPDGRVNLDDFVATVRAGLAARPTVEHRLDFLLSETSFSHEICHFHDCVCSSAGFYAFAREWFFAYSIYVVAKGLRKTGWSAGDSIVSLYQTARTEGISEMFNVYSNLMIQRVLNNGDLEWIEVDPSYGSLDVVWGTFPLAGETVRIPFFPANVGIDGEWRCYLVPIGFRALTECRAVLHQLFVIGSFGQEYVELYLQHLGLQFEYRVVNMLFTRVVKNHGLDPHAGTWMIHEMFRVLSATLARESDPTRRPIGQVFLEELRRVDPQTGIYAGSHEENVRHMRDALAGIEPELFTDYTGDWHGYMMRDLARDSFRRAIDVYAAADASVFTPDSLDWYGTQNHTLPYPPISTRGGHLGHLPSLSPDDVLYRVAAVTGTVLFRTMVEQGMVRKGLRCPVLEGPYSEFLRAAQIHEHCNQGIAVGDCGRFSVGDDVRTHCDCPWKGLAQDIGFAR